MFLLPGFMITAYISKMPLQQEYKTEVIRYLTGKQHPDGGWGLHVESESTAFGTALNYITLRLLGLGRDDPRCTRARARLHKFGGAGAVPHWGKVWMSVLGVYEWEGVSAVLPELWMLPYKLPIHPGRFWCHCRVVYLPMAWLYGSKSVGPITPLVKELREELYTEPYEKINWPAQRFNCAQADLYKPHSLIVKTVFPLCNIWDKCAPAWLRQKALDETLDHIRYEDEQTHYIDIGPVNKAMDMLVEFFASNGKSDAFKQHCDRFYDYLWLAADGLKCQGYNGCQLWDTAFTMQALAESGVCGESERLKNCVKQTYHYLDITQVRENAPESDKYFRHISKGAWPFSTRDHGWPIADCTAEGFRGVMIGNDAFDFLPKLEDDHDGRLFDAVNVMLSYQNADGGWPTYENQRSYAWLEYLNPAECFDGIMVDYSYVELSSACIRSLLYFQKQYPNHRKAEIDRACKRGIDYILNIQRPDGSWHGSWAVCYTYGTWFGVEALVATGHQRHEGVDRACEFLLAHQRSDGAWGEDFKSCVERRWVEHKEGHAVHTSWAVMTLMVAARDNDRDKMAVRRGIRWIIEKQHANGDWDQPQICGVFNFNCAIEYQGYKNIFTIWALGRFWRFYKWGGDLDLTNL
jgi:squalene/oxidosqualene cyclase-like protein